MRFGIKYFVFIAVSFSLLASDNPVCSEVYAFIHTSHKYQEYLDILNKSKMKTVRVLERGDSKPLEVELERGIHGVFKAKTEKQNTFKEVAAFRIDRLLGLNVVPVTVVRKHLGKEGSLQHFVPDGQNPYFTQSAPNPNIAFLDLFIGNTDRSGDNYLVLKNGKQAAIDHTNAFRTLEMDLPHEWVLRRCVPERDVYLKFKNTSAENFHSELDSLIGKENVDKLIDRRDRIVKIFDQWIGSD